jgi:ATP-dependent DNA helicase RecG
MTISELLKKDFFEDKTNEIKSRLNGNNPVDWLKAIVAFANGNGGMLYIGVRDDGLLVGFEKSEIEREKNLLINCVNQFVLPRLSLSFAYLHYEDNDGRRYVIAVSVPSSSSKPVYLTYKKAQSVFVREDGFCRLASRDEIGRMYLDNDRFPFDMQRTDVKYEQKDFSLLFAAYFKNTGKSLNDKALASIGFFDDEGYLRKGALFFKDGYQDDALLIKAVEWDGIDRAGDVFYHPSSCSSSLLEEVDFCLTFVSSHSKEGYRKESNGRVSVFSYPKRSIFEAVINALAHRNYYISGSFIQLDLFADRLEITSPGSLPCGFSNQAPIYDLSSIRPQTRNPLICKVLELLRYMEALGTGFDKIVADYSSSDKSHRPFALNGNDSFSVVLPNLLYAGGVLDADSLPAVLHGFIENGSEYDDRILSFCCLQERSAPEIASFLKISLSTHLRKDIIGNLVRQGFLAVKTKGKRSIYVADKRKVSIG